MALFGQTHFVIECLPLERAKVRKPCPLPLRPDCAGIMRPGPDQSTPFGLAVAAGARCSRRFIAQNESRHRLLHIPCCRMTKRAEARAPLFCPRPGERVLTQSRGGAKQTFRSAAGIPRSGSHAALEALAAVEKRCRRCALPPQSKIFVLQPGNSSRLCVKEFEDRRSNALRVAPQPQVLIADGLHRVDVARGGEQKFTIYEG